MFNNNPKAGAFNLLNNCLHVQAGDSVLLVLEPTTELYDEELGLVFQTCLEELGASTTVVVAAIINDPADFPVSVAEPMKDSDHTIFLSRVGDYVRFVPLPGSGSKVTCYTLTTDMLGSPYATVDYRLMQQLMLKLEDELMAAGEWRLQCLLGTDISGGFYRFDPADEKNDNFTVTLFPVATFNPVRCDTASGQVALSRWLMPGGATRLENTHTNINGVVHAHVKDGYIENFTGNRVEVERIKLHYDRINNSLGISANRVHSWHTGINPQTRFDQCADDFLDRWSAISFGSPRYLHFHTCGDEPPGEVAWSAFNPTITIDGVVYWRDGEFVWLQREDNKALIRSYERGYCLLEPSRQIGIASRL